VIFCEINFISS
jgi:hypothetical protein